MTARFGRAPGLLVEPLGEGWAAFSPLSGETMLINDESAAIIEVLEVTPGSIESVCARLAADLGETWESLLPRIEPHWSQLVEAGLVVEVANEAA